MKTIVLIGKSNTGKSETLIKLAEKFCYVLRPKVLAEIGIVIKSCNKTIAIYSKCDSTRDIKEGIERIKKTKCKIDVLVCACHPTNKKGIDYLKSITKQFITVTKTVSNSARNQSNDNRYDANRLYKLI